MNHRYKFSKDEVDKLLKENLVILYDTREQINDHILRYFKTKGIKCKRKKIDEGDYTAIITVREDMGIYRDLYFNFAVERKNSVDELIGSIKNADRFEDEFNRAKIKGIDIHLVVEEENGLKNMRKGKYRSQYLPNALWGKYHSIEHKYLKGATFVASEDSGEAIYSKLYYAVRNILNNGEIQIEPLEEVDHAQLNMPVDDVCTNVIEMKVQTEIKEHEYF